MSAAPARCRPLPVPAAGLGWAAVLLAAAGLGAAAAPWALRAGVAAVAAVAAAAWGWRNVGGSGRGWVAAAPLAAWVVGTCGWGGATAVGVAALVALLRRRPPAEPLRWPRSPRTVPPAAPAVPMSPAVPDAWTDGVEPGEEFEDESYEDEDEDAGPEPDQWFARTADAAEGELTVTCAGGVGAGHVLFWPAFAAAPRVRCHPADGLGRVRAARVLPQGVRFEVTRPDGESGPVRVCYEATAPGR